MVAFVGFNIGYVRKEFDLSFMYMYELFQVEVTDGALLGLIENYCRESGVRNLQKHIEKIYRKVCSAMRI